MKNHRPLQFIKDLPSYTELWKIIDETITKPMEGLSVETLKYYLYLYIRLGDFKETKKVLQTNMETEDVLSIKAHIRSISTERTIKYAELLPVVKGLPKELIHFLYCNLFSYEVVPEHISTEMHRIVSVLNEPMPKLTSLIHTPSVTEVSSKYELELAINRIMVDETAIPIFKLVRDTKAYPRYFKYKKDNSIVEFTDLSVGTIVVAADDDDEYPIGYTSEKWIDHTDTDIWVEVDNPEEVIV